MMNKDNHEPNLSVRVHGEYVVQKPKGPFERLGSAMERLRSAGRMVSDLRDELIGETGETGGGSAGMVSGGVFGLVETASQDIEGIADQIGSAVKAIRSRL